MLYAHEARRKTLEKVKECTTTELSKLEKQVNEAIDNGEFYISSNGCLQPETIQRLEELGYKVKTGSQYNEHYYSISWKE